MGVRICIGSEAHALLASEDFIASWQRLYEHCPWATAAQHPEFARCWYRVYKEREVPIIVFQQRGQELVGLLALYRRDGLLVHVGRDDSEYHVWTALPECGEGFMPDALAALSQALGSSAMALDHMPPETPLAWLAGRSSPARRCELAQTSRRVLRVSDPEFVRTYVRGKSRLKTTMNKLKRTGAVRFFRADDAAAIKRLIVSSIPLFEFRKGAVYGELPFRDEPLRREFLLAQAEVPGLLHVTALERDGKVLAAHVATAGRRELSIAGIVHSEFEGQHSPGALLILELIQLLSREGLELLDFTPGDDEYKARFAAETQPVYTLRVHATRLSCELRRARELGSLTIKHLIHKLPGALLRPLLALKSKPANPTAVAAPSNGAAIELHRLVLTRSTAPSVSPSPEVASRGWEKNSIEQLVCYVGGRAEYIELLRSAFGYVRAGAEMYTRTSDTVLEALCFVLPGSGFGRAALLEGLVLCELENWGNAALRAEWARELALLLGPERPLFVARPSLFDAASVPHEPGLRVPPIHLLRRAASESPSHDNQPSAG